MKNWGLNICFACMAVVLLSIGIAAAGNIEQANIGQSITNLFNSGYVAYADPAGTLHTQDIEPTADDTNDIGTASARYQDGWFSGNVTASAITDSGLTAGRAVYAGTGGLLSSEAGYEYNAGTNTLSVPTLSSTTVGATTLNAPTGRGPTCVIAASDDPQKDQADLEVDDVSDARVQAAITASAGGSVIFRGTFTKTGIDYLTVPSNTYIGGTASITLANGINDTTGIFTNSDTANGNTNISIVDLILRGNYKNNTGSQYGIKMENVTNSNIDCWIEDFNTQDIAVKNIEKAGFIRNRYYSPDFMPQEKKALTIESSDGWSIVSGSPTLANSTKYIFGSGSLQVQIGASATVAIEKTLTTPLDLRFYPILNFHVCADTDTQYPPADWLQITLIDSDGNSVSTAYGYYAHWDYNRYNRLDIKSWSVIPVSVADFVWSNNYYILKDVAKVRLSMKGRATTGTVVNIDDINAVLGLQRPTATMVFDDSRQTMFDNGYPLLTTFGYKSVLPVNPCLIDNNVLFTDWDAVYTMYYAGWDIISHSMTHAQEATLGTHYVDAGYYSRTYWEWRASRAYLERKNFKGAEYFAHIGNGDNYQAALELYYTAGRVDYYAGGFALPYGNTMRLFPYVPNLRFNWQDIDNLRRFHLWGIGIDHGVGGPGDDTDVATFTTRLERFRDYGFEVLTFSEIFEKYPQNSPATTFNDTYYTDVFMDIHAASSNNIHTGIAGNGAVQNITTFDGQPDYARNISITVTNNNSPSGSIYVYGTDARKISMAQKVTLVPGGTVYTTGAFATITKVTIPATVAAGDTITVGVGDCLGLRHWILESTDVQRIVKNGAPVTVSDSMLVFYNDLMSWEATVDMSTISDGDNIIIYYKSNM